MPDGAVCAECLGRAELAWPFGVEAARGMKHSVVVLVLCERARRRGCARSRRLWLVIEPTVLGQAMADRRIERLVKVDYVVR